MKAFSALVLAAALMVPSAAAAKGGRDAHLCGQDGCVAIHAQTALRNLASGRASRTEAPVPDDFYVLNFGVGETPEYYAAYYVREARALAANGPASGQLLWFVTGPGLEAELRQAAGAITPFPTNGWPAELKSPGRVGMLATSTDERAASKIELRWVAAAVLLAALATALVIARGRAPRSGRGRPHGRSRAAEHLA